MTLLAIDPGPTQSAYVVFYNDLVIECRIETNDDMIERIDDLKEQFLALSLAIEGIQSF